MVAPLAALFLLVALMPVESQAQTSAGVRGSIRDTQDGSLPGVVVVLVHPSSGLERRVVSDAAGRFEMANVPVGTHDLSFALAGFAPERRKVSAPRAAWAELDVVLTIAAMTDQVRVTPDATLDTESAGTRHAVSVTRIERLPVAVSSRGIESVLVSFPGFSQNANGAIHPRGAHNQMTFVVDGLPVSDQLTGAFANALDVGVVETAEVLMGNIPADFGGKVSGVAVLNSRSGLGTGRPFTGSLSASAGGFGTTQASVQAGGEGRRVGYFGSVTGFRTVRFLDQVSLDNVHNSGRYVRGFGRIDVNRGRADRLRFHVMGGASRFELANLRSQQDAGQDQRQRLADVSTWVAYQRALGPAGTSEVTAGYRTTSAALVPSAGDTPVTVEQERRLTTYTLTANITRAVGRHIIRAGLDAQRFPVREAFSMGITSLAFNNPADARYNAALAPYDLGRGGVLFRFDEARAGTAAGGFVQSSWAIGPTSLALGLRYDEYRFLVTGRQWQPRVGVAHRLAGRDLVVRASYNRNYQTPPNENLLLSNSESASRLAPESVRQALGGAYRPIRPERQDVFEAGVQMVVAPGVTLDTAVYEKRSRDQQDNNNFFDTGIIFPTTLASIRVTGLESRLTVLPRRGLSGSLSATSGRAISSPPFTGGLFLGQDAVDLLSAGPFAIDHDQRFSLHGSLSFDPVGPAWVGATVRHDSGLVSNPSNPAQVAADPDFADLLPYVNLAASVPRVRPRTVVDLAAGVDMTDARGRKTWNAQVQITNLTNRTALYNFQSVFVGTRLIQPRTLSVRVSRGF